MKKLDPVMTTYVRPDRIRSICIGKDRAYIADKAKWSFIFTKENDEWVLEKVKMKRRYGNGRIKTNHGRRHEKQRRHY